MALDCSVECNITLESCYLPKDSERDTKGIIVYPAPPNQI
jgi:hypothetical protein